MSDAMELPPLPVPAYEGVAFFSITQMRAYGEQCARAAVAGEREACAKIAKDSGSLQAIDEESGENYWLDMDETIEHIANAIRARTTP
ncbi:hypothetical protein J2D73_17395 [Acetobacter sacchari]|uniref:Uncharacterized protein n=1 Tax=Acetobacter sacchari TaxID=2661687 RepID=A0ABS3M0A1_9PROT|nr:hypothetical protein [Acetobacter sacchari]MBO1361563.1 hypothetical protein [Acetobacter sacchari]